MPDLSAFKKAALSALVVLSLGCTAAAADDEDINPFAKFKHNQQSAQSASGTAAASTPAAKKGSTPTVQPSAPVAIPAPPEFDAQAWVLMDYASGHVVCAKNQDEKIWPASLTKMMTSYVIGTEIKAGRLHMNDNVTITEDAWAKKYTDSSKMFIEVGKAIKVEDLVKGIVIQSGNDACVAMAIHLAGNQEDFVSVMNEYAARLGLKNTHFANVHGLFDEYNYSTAYDMALLGRALIHDLPEEYALYKQKEFTFNGIKQYNRNRLLWDKSMNVDGIKTGHLSQVGYNLVSSATQDNMRLIAAVIGAGSEKSRAEFCKSLMQYGFRYFEQYIPYTSGKVLLNREVRMGDQNSVDLILKEDLSVLVPRGREKEVKIRYRLKSGTFIAPIRQGQVLGTIDVKLNDALLGSAPLTAAQDIGQGGPLSRAWDRVVMFFTSSDKEVEAVPEGK